MLNSRRALLDRVDKSPTTHAGLWLDRYLPRQLVSGESVASGSQTPVTALFEQVAGMGEPREYIAFFRRWQDGLASVRDAGEVLKTFRAKVQGRMVVGLGTDGVLENSIALHRTYGVPLIPGSALKGLASSFAHRRAGVEWKKNTEAHRILFGDTSAAGYVTFYDALYIPKSGFQGKPLWPDVMTVHHKDYYQGNKPPTDWDSPTPIPFLSATGSYLVALRGPGEWVDAAASILSLALENEGVGAKTSSGYGRLALEPIS